MVSASFCQHSQVAEPTAKWRWLASRACRDMYLSSSNLRIKSLVTHSEMILLGLYPSPTNQCSSPLRIDSQWSPIKKPSSWSLVMKTPWSTNPDPVSRQLHHSCTMPTMAMALCGFCWIPNNDLQYDNIIRLQWIHQWNLDLGYPWIPK